MKNILIFCLLLATGSVRADYYSLPEYRVFGEAYSTTDEQDIDRLMADFLHHWSERDAHAVARLHTDDMEWINAFGRNFRDRTKLQAFLADTLFPAFEAPVWRSAMASYRPISRRYLSPQVTVINAQLHSTPGSAMAAGDRRISLNLVLLKRDGHWKIAQEIISDIRKRRGSGE